MGIYLNPGNENFREILSGEIYVDKTMMLSDLNRFMRTGNKYICVSRPRRFGKTVAQNMISAYYSKGCDSSDIFRNLKIAGVSGYEKNMNCFNVIQMDMNGEYQTAENKNNMLKNLLRKVKEEIRDQFTDLQFYEEDSLADMMLRVYSDTKETFIILIDEYDVLVREQIDEVLFKEYMSLLNGLFKNNTLRPAMIIELKRNKTAESAVDQIKNKRYFDSLSHYSGNLLFIGIDYDEDKKTHECRIEKFVK